MALSKRFDLLKFLAILAKNLSFLARICKFNAPQQKWYFSKMKHNKFKKAEKKCKDKSSLTLTKGCLSVL